MNNNSKSSIQNDDDSSPLVKMAQTLDNLKLMYEYENQEAFALNYHLFNDNVNLTEQLKEATSDFNALRVDFQAQSSLIETLTENLKLKSDEVRKLKVELAEHKRTQFSLKRINKSLNSMGLNASMRSNSVGSGKRRGKNHLTLPESNYDSIESGFWSPKHTHATRSNLDKSLNTSSVISTAEGAGGSVNVGFNDVDICDYCKRDKSVKLVNLTNELIEIGDWKLNAFVNGVEMLEFRFNLTAVLWPNTYIKVGFIYLRRFY